MTTRPTPTPPNATEPTPSEQNIQAAQTVAKWRSERRIRLVSLPESWLRFMVMAGVHWQSPDMRLGLFLLPEARGLPADAVAIGTVWAADRDCILVALVSSVWDPVPEGMPAPMLPEQPVWRTRQVQVERVDDKPLPIETEATPPPSAPMTPGATGSTLVLALLTALAIATAFGLFPWWL